MKVDKNLPNYLTIARILAIPVIVFTFYFEDSKLARQLGATIFVIASITDFFDGYLARRFKIISGFGRMFDPIADKMLVGCVIVMLIKYRGVNEIPCLLILSREFTIAGLREFLAQLSVSVPVSHLSKVKTTMQMTALTLLILGSKGSGVFILDYIANILLWITACLTMITSYSYLKASVKYF